ncbi:MAG TPA: tetratricopeptide repeat protein [Chryseosolibacter sp.]|nr:tetratricopeptide repeat protein [Chryseosolibacter sp.]
MRANLFFWILLFWSCFPAIGQDKPKKAFEIYEQAEAAYNADKYEAALTLLNECLKQYPGYFEGYSLRGSVKEILKDNDGALTDYSIYLEQFPEHLPVLLSRGILRYKIGFYDQAKEDFFKLLHMDPVETNTVFYRQNMSVGDRNPVMTPESGHKSYIYNYLGLTEAKQKNHQKAIAFYDSALAMNPNEPDYFVNRGLSKEAVNDSTAAADYEKALKLNNRHTLARHNLTALKTKQGQTMTYEDRLTETIKEDSTMLYPYLERAMQRFEGGYYKGAVEDYTSALEIDPGDEEIWLGRGLAREKIKDYEGAFSDYTKAIEIKEDFFKAWINRGNVLFKLERYSDAIEDFNVALIYQSNYAPAVYNRAMAKVKMKNKVEACADIKLAESMGMEIDPKVRSKVCE